MVSTPRGGESDQPLSHRSGAASCGCTSSGVRSSRNDEPLIDTHVEGFVRVSFGPSKGGVGAGLHPMSCDIFRRMREGPKNLNDVINHV